jgi:hypothetical protein
MKIKLGQRIRVAPMSGLDSDKFGTVVSAHKVTVGYDHSLVNRLGWIPVILDGQQFATVFPRTRLRAIKKESAQ